MMGHVLRHTEICRQLSIEKKEGINTYAGLKRLADCKKMEDEVKRCKPTYYRLKKKNKYRIYTLNVILKITGILRIFLNLKNFAKMY